MMDFNNCKNHEKEFVIKSGKKVCKFCFDKMEYQAKTVCIKINYAELIKDNTSMEPIFSKCYIRKNRK